MSLAKRGTIHNQMNPHVNGRNKPTSIIYLFVRKCFAQHISQIRVEHTTNTIREQNTPHTDGRRIRGIVHDTLPSTFHLGYFVHIEIQRQDMNRSQEKLCRDWHTHLRNRIRHFLIGNDGTVLQVLRNICRHSETCRNGHQISDDEQAPGRQRELLRWSATIHLCEIAILQNTQCHIDQRGTSQLGDKGVFLHIFVIRQHGIGGDIRSTVHEADK